MNHTSQLILQKDNQETVLTVLETEEKQQISWGDYQIHVEQSKHQDKDVVRIEQVISGCSQSGRDEHVGIRIENSLSPDIQPDCKWRFFIPTLVYTLPEKLDMTKRVTYMEDRLTANLFTAYNCDNHKAYQFGKINCAVRTSKPERELKQNYFYQETETGYIGYETEPDSMRILYGWPAKEETYSVALDSMKTPLYTSYPLNGKSFHIILQYEYKQVEQSNFTTAVYEAYREMARHYEMIGEKVAELPQSLEDFRICRKYSLSKCYREFGKKGAGFFFHFDPVKGYESMPSGFSTSFETIPHNTYQHILEYGFTGREINTALIMAKEEGGKWRKRGEKIIQFFLEKCMTSSGWLYSLYDLDTDAPFYSCGDKDAPKLHYISRKQEKGNYLRTMTEPMNDVLESYQFYKQTGTRKEEWLKQVICFANFLLCVQNADGSWYRAYQPNGRMADVGGDEDLTPKKREEGQKAASAIPLIFLSNLYQILTEEGKEAAQYLEAAGNAGEYVLRHAVFAEHYQGGTLDNPNVVDKEAAQYVMAGLYHLYTVTEESRYFEGALQAARIFTTWNYIWNAPTMPGTILHDKKFKTKGLGAINSIWGGGVVDIYSLFHLREFYQIGVKSQESFMCELAEWIAAGTQQILSCPADKMGFADLGMQPEGFGICPQGVDDGQIDKGDIWGTLGWIYSAGIYGLGNFLKLHNEKGEEQ